MEKIPLHIVVAVGVSILAYFTCLQAFPLGWKALNCGWETLTYGGRTLTNATMETLAFIAAAPWLAAWAVLKKVISFAIGLAAVRIPGSLGYEKVVSLIGDAAVPNNKLLALVITPILLMSSRCQNAVEMVLRITDVLLIQVPRAVYIITYVISGGALLHSIGMGLFLPVGVPVLAYLLYNRDSNTRRFYF